MTVTTTGPSTAERVRTSCARARQAVLAVDGSEPVTVSVHHLRNGGDAVLAVPADVTITALAWQAGRGGLPAVLELTDHAPLTLRERVRSLVWLRGNLHAVPSSALRPLAAAVAAENPDPALLDVGHTTTFLRLVLDSAVVADAQGADAVAIDELVSATPDPFWAVEDRWLEHLESDHADMIDTLAQRLPHHMRTGPVRALGLDRYGLRLRVEAHDGDRDIRLPFPEPVSDVTDLNRAIRVLVGCPFGNGLRARR